MQDFSKELDMLHHKIAPSDRSSLGRNGRKRDKNQVNWMRIEEVMQIVVIVATMTFIVVTMT